LAIKKPLKQHERFKFEVKISFFDLTNHKFGQRLIEKLLYFFSYKFQIK